MKTFMIFAAVALSPISAFAHAPISENGRAELIEMIEANRTALLPQTEPPPQVTVLHQPRLNNLRDLAQAARTSEELARVRKEFGDWRRVVLRELHKENERIMPGGESFSAFSSRRFEEINFVAALHRQFAAQRVEAEARKVREASLNSGASGSSWARLFDNKAPLEGVVGGAGAADGAVRAEFPSGADRYAKIRALLLSQGVSRQIVDTAIAEGVRQRVDPMIVLSVINQESNFRRNAYNKGSGCVGLMQLDRATAADMGMHGNLFDAGNNIMAGVKYLNWIANSFFRMNLDMSDLSKIPEEKLKIVLASYNWGVGNVQRSMRRYGTPALDHFAPKETRNYIAEIPRRIYSWFASV